MPSKTTHHNGVTVAFIVFALTFALPTHGGRVEELQTEAADRENKIKALEQEIAGYQNSIEEAEETSNTLSGEIKMLNARIKKFNADIRLTAERMRKTELTIEQLTFDIGGTTNDITDRRAALADLLRNLHESEGQTIIEVMLAHEQLSDFFSSVEQLMNVDKALGQNLSELKTLKTNLEDTKSRTETERTRLKNLQRELDARRSIEEGARKERSTLLARTKQSEAQYQKLLKTREKEREAITAEIDAIENELRKLIDPSKLPTSGSGVLTWPLAKPYITQGYGFTTFATTRSDIYKGKGHNGIDLRAAVGTPLLATADGVIVDVGDTDLSCPGGSYGKWIVLKHDNNLASVYAHLSYISVRAGQQVTRGEQIGYTGNSGYSLGPHLHFSVYDASTLRFAASASGRCSRQPYGGPLNPLDYLTRST